MAVQSHNEVIGKVPRFLYVQHFLLRDVEYIKKPLLSKQIYLIALIIMHMIHITCYHMPCLLRILNQKKNK